MFKTISFVSFPLLPRVACPSTAVRGAPNPAALGSAPLPAPSSPAAVSSPFFLLGTRLHAQVAEQPLDGCRWGSLLDRFMCDAGPAGRHQSRREAPAGAWRPHRRGGRTAGHFPTRRAAACQVSSTAPLPHCYSARGLHALPAAI
jgi:hypothetical protein